MKILSVIFWSTFIIYPTETLAQSKETNNEKSFSEDSLRCGDQYNSDKSISNSFGDLYRPHSHYDQNEKNHYDYNQKRSALEDYTMKREALQKRQVGVIYRDDKPIGILQPYQRTYRFIPVKEENGLSLEMNPAQDSLYPASSMLEKREAGESDTGYLEDSYPSILTNFRIDSKLDKKRYGINDNNVQELKDTVRKLRSPHSKNNEKIEAELKGILDDMGLIEDDSVNAEKRDVSNKEQYSNEEDASNNDNFDKNRNKRDDCSSGALNVAKPEATNKNNFLTLEEKRNEIPEENSGKRQAASEDSLDEVEEDAFDKNRKKREKSDSKDSSELVQNLKDSGDLTLSGNKSPLASSSELIENENGEEKKSTGENSEYEERFSRQIHDRINSLKEEIKKELASELKQSQKSAQEDDSKRKKRQITTLVDTESAAVDPVKNSGDVQKPLVRKRRRTEETSASSRKKRDLVPVGNDDFENLLDQYDDGTMKKRNVEKLMRNPTNRERRSSTDEKTKDFLAKRIFSKQLPKRNKRAIKGGKDVKKRELGKGVGVDPVKHSGDVQKPLIRKKRIRKMRPLVRRKRDENAAESDDLDNFFEDFDDAINKREAEEENKIVKDSSFVALNRQKRTSSNHETEELTSKFIEDMNTNQLIDDQKRKKREDRKAARSLDGASKETGDSKDLETGDSDLDSLSKREPEFLANNNDNIGASSSRTSEENAEKVSKTGEEATPISLLKWKNKQGSSEKTNEGNDESEDLGIADFHSSVSKFSDQISSGNLDQEQNVDINKIATTENQAMRSSEGTGKINDEPRNLVVEGSDSGSLIKRDLEKDLKDETSNRIKRTDFIYESKDLPAKEEESKEIIKGQLLERKEREVRTENYRSENLATEKSYSDPLSKRNSDEIFSRIERANSRQKSNDFFAKNEDTNEIFRVQLLKRKKRESKKATNSFRENGKETDESEDLKGFHSDSLLKRYSQEDRTKREGSSQETKDLSAKDEVNKDIVKYQISKRKKRESGMVLRSLETDGKENDESEDLETGESYSDSLSKRDSEEELNDKTSTRTGRANYDEETKGENNNEIVSVQLLRRKKRESNKAIRSSEENGKETDESEDLEDSDYDSFSKRDSDEDSSDRKKKDSNQETKVLSAKDEMNKKIVKDEVQKHEKREGIKSSHTSDEARKETNEPYDLVMEESNSDALPKRNSEEDFSNREKRANSDQESKDISVKIEPDKELITDQLLQRNKREKEKTIRSSDEIKEESDDSESMAVDNCDSPSKRELDQYSELSDIHQGKKRNNIYDDYVYENENDRYRRQNFDDLDELEDDVNPPIRRLRSRSKRRINEDQDNLDRPQQLSDLSDFDLFGALPQSYDGELSRYKRIRRDPV